MLKQKNFTENTSPDLPGRQPFVRWWGVPLMIAMVLVVTPVIGFFFGEYGVYEHSYFGLMVVLAILAPITAYTIKLARCAWLPLSLLFGIFIGSAIVVASFIAAYERTPYKTYETVVAEDGSEQKTERPATFWEFLEARAYEGSMYKNPRNLAIYERRQGFAWLAWFIQAVSIPLVTSAAAFVGTQMVLSQRPGQRNVTLDKR